MCMCENTIVWIYIVVVVAFVIHCPIFKPWFGFRKPKGHRGQWWT